MEFVLIAPLFLVLVFGIVAFGLLLFSLMSAQHAAREGARLAAVGVDDCATWVSEVRGRSVGVPLEDGGLSMSYTGSAEVGGEVLVEMDLDLGTSGSLYSAATSLFSDGGSITGSTVTARSRAEQIGSEASCVG